MGAAAPDIVGKTISAIVLKRRPQRPVGQLFLVFTDGTYYEFFSSCDDINGASGIHTGGLEAARRYGGDQWIVLEAAQPLTPDGPAVDLRNLGPRDA
jgi:hypothetical protein